MAQRMQLQPARGARPIRNRMIAPCDCPSCTWRRERSLEPDHGQPVAPHEVPPVRAFGDPLHRVAPGI